MRLLPLLFASVVIGLLGSLGWAQVREPGTPASARASLAPDVPQVVFELPTDRVRQEPGAPVDGGPFRYGVELPVGLGIEDTGRFETVPATGELVWRLELASPRAHSLGLVFSRFDLPPGAQVFLYDPARSTLLGAYGESAENPNGVLAVQPLRGDRVVIEYVEPPGTLVRPALEIGTVVHDTLDLFAHMAQGSWLALACLVDVNCPVAAAHQDLKRATIWMVRSGAGCSGSILNNTAEDGTPYMMTAEHCGDFTNGVFVFDYERSACSAGSSSQSKTLSGATRLAVSSFYDAQLYRLNQAIPASYEPFFAGWSRATRATPTIGISHPGGQPKKIQIDRQSAFLVQTRWSVQNDVGAVQPGSSGSPLFNQDERVIGTLSTGGGGCSANGNYGRFDLFYANHGLAPWLDPLGWGLSGIDGFDPIAPYTQPYYGTGTNPRVYRSLTEPRLGTTWSAAIDTSSVPSATSTYLLGQREPAEGGSSPYGEILIDLTSPRFFERTAPVVAGRSTHSFVLPSSVSLVGRVAYSQAFTLGPVVRATNGLKVVLNF